MTPRASRRAAPRAGAGSWLAMFRGVVLRAGLALLPGLALGQGSAPAAPAAPAGLAGPAATAAIDAPTGIDDHARQATLAGAARSWRELRPDGVTRPRAIVLLLHGNGGSAASLLGDGRPAAPYRRWREIARRERLWLVAPDGLPGPDGRRGWNDCRADATGNPDVDDTGFLLALLSQQRLEAGRRDLPAFVVGTSNGGNMALRVAIERPEVFRAHAAIVAAMPARSECAAPTRPASVLFANGTADPILPFGGGEVWVGPVFRGTSLGTLVSARAWARLDGAAGAPRIVTLPDLDGNGLTIERSTWRGRGRGRRRHDTVLYTVQGGGHAEPSRSERLPRATRQSGDVEIADEIWGFFAPRLHP